MNFVYLRYSFRSLVMRLLLYSLLLLFPVVGLLFYNISLSRNTLVNQIKSAHSNMLDGYSLQLQGQMESVGFYLTNQLFYGNDTQVISQSSDPDTIQYAYRRIMDSQKSQLMVSDFMDGLFIYIRQRDNYRAMISSPGHTHSSLTQERLIRWFEKAEAQNTALSDWKVIQINGEEYLLYVIGNSETQSYAGAFVKVSQLIEFIAPSDSSTGQLTLLNIADLQNFQTQLPDNLLMTTSSVGEHLILAEIFTRSSITEGLPTLPRYGSLELILILIMLALYFSELSRIILRPILGLASDMNKVESGNLDHRATIQDSSSEMKMLSSAFNRMLDNIQNLTVNVMQSQLKTQRAQLRNLQLQIKPHFLINSLNMIYNLIETEQYKNAQRLILHSVDYFRYMTKVDADLVPLNEEIEHIRSYLEIQTLRYKNMFVYDIDIDPMVEDMLVPPMMIQNYIENSIKYALNTDQTDSRNPLSLSVHVTSFEKDYYPYATIIIRDTGSGYPAEMLTALNAGEKIIKKDGSHIGLRNTTQRLQFLFGEKVTWKYSNSGGAMTEITMPVTFSEEED